MPNHFGHNWEVFSDYDKCIKCGLVRIIKSDRNSWHRFTEYYKDGKKLEKLEICKNK